MQIFISPPVFNGSSEREWGGARSPIEQRRRSLRSFLCSFLSMNPVYWFCRIYWNSTVPRNTVDPVSITWSELDFDLLFCFVFFFSCVAFGCNIWETINGTLLYFENWNGTSLNFIRASKIKSTETKHSRAFPRGMKFRFLLEIVKSEFPWKTGATKKVRRRNKWIERNHTINNIVINIIPELE